MTSELERQLCRLQATSQGKADEGKLRWSLLPVNALEEIVRVLEFGAEKYEPNGWKSVAPGRYTDALLRHVFTWMKGEERDAESGERHLAHAGCCILFLLHHAEQERNK